MRVKATAIGFDNLCLRQAGDIFDMPEGSDGPWFEKVDVATPLTTPESKLGKFKSRAVEDDLA